MDFRNIPPKCENENFRYNTRHSNSWPHKKKIFSLRLEPEDESSRLQLGPYIKPRDGSPQINANKLFLPIHINVIDGISLPVLKIRDILVRIRILISDPYLYDYWIRIRI
jgi:hypothetical protein